MATCIVTADASNLKINGTTPATLQTRSETNTGSRFVVTYPTNVTQAHGCFVIPPNYLTGNITFRARYVAPVATSGSFTAQLTYFKFVDGTADNAGVTTITATASPTGSAGGLFEAVLTISSNLPTVGVTNFYPFRLSRVTTDTVTGDVDLLDYSIEYTFDSNMIKQYTWLPANIWLARAGSPSTLGSGTTLLSSAATLDPYCHQLPDSAGNALGTHIQLPSTFTGGLTSYTVIASGANGGNAGLGLSMGNAAVGAAFDASLTTDAATLTLGAASTVYIKSRSAPISPSAGDMLSLQEVRDNSDANTGILNFYGVLLEYNVFTASPSPVIDLSPECWSAPTSNAAALLGVSDTNNSEYVQRFTQGVDQKCDSKRINPSIFVSGGTFRGYLRTTASSGTIQMRIDYANPANGANADPSLTTGSTINVPVTGANQLLMFTADVSSGLLASDEVFLVMNRLGSGDGVTADVDYVEGHIEVSVGA
jgi:hypothetical protein